MDERESLFEVRDDIKKTLKLLGKKMSDLSRELQIDYNILNGYINGRRKMTSKMADRINYTFSRWAND